MKHVYKIYCERDVKFEKLYSTSAKAHEEILNYDWSDIFIDEDETIEGLLEGCMVGVEELDVM